MTPETFAAFQAGCRQRLARKALSSMEAMRREWGYSVSEARAFESGYNCTRLTQEIIKGGAAQEAAERELLEGISALGAKFKVRERLTRLLAVRAATLK